MSWQAAMEADEELRQRLRQQKGMLNQVGGTGYDTAMSPRYQTNITVRPSDIDPNIKPGGKSDKWVMTPGSGTGIRQTLHGDPSAFTGRAYQAALAKNAARHSGAGTRPQRRHAPQRAAYQAALKQQRAQAEGMQMRRMAAPHMGQAMANQLAARALGNQGQPMGGVMGQGPMKAWAQHPANTGVPMGQPAGGSYWDHRRAMTERRLEGAEARHQEALRQAGRTRSQPWGFGSDIHGGQGVSSRRPLQPGELTEPTMQQGIGRGMYRRSNLPFGHQVSSARAPDPYDILDEDYIENMYA